MADLASLALPEINAGTLASTGAQNAGDARAIKSYLYQLTEQLRYVLGNLDEENFTAGVQRKLEGGGLTSVLEQNLTGLRAAVEGQAGQISSLTVDVSGLHTTVQNQAGQVSQLNQTAQALQSSMADAEKNTSQLSQTVTGLQTSVANAEGAISTLSQTSQSITAKVEGNEGEIASLQAMRDSLKLSVTNGTDNSVISLTGTGIKAQSSTIKFTGKVVFANDLKTAGSTTINGSNITTGTIKAGLLSTGTIKGKTGSSSWDLDTGELISGTSSGTHVTMTKDAVRWYRDGNLTGVVRSVIGSTYYTANSTFCYFGWCDDEDGTKTGKAFGYGGHGLHTLPFKGMWGVDEALDISAVVEAGLVVSGPLRLPNDGMECAGGVRVGGKLTCANGLELAGGKFSPGAGTAEKYLGWARVQGADGNQYWALCGYDG